MAGVTEAKGPAHCCTAELWEQDVNPGCLIPESVFLTTHRRHPTASPLWSLTLFEASIPGRYTLVA